MDSDEEEGLRAFTLSVDAYAGASYPERPRWIERDGVRADVTEVESRWQEDERIGFRVRLADGQIVLMYYVPELDLWSGVWTPGGGVPTIKRRRR
jgi:hypothetical protein